MTVVLDASVVLRWFVAQKGSEAAERWLRDFALNPGLFIAPDLLRFEVHGALSRLQPSRDEGWAARAFDRFDRLGVQTLPTTMELFRRAHVLSRELRIGGYDAIYLAHAESLRMPWLTADEKALRRLASDPRVTPLVPPLAEA